MLRATQRKMGQKTLSTRLKKTSSSNSRDSDNGKASKGVQCRQVMILGLIATFVFAVWIVVFETNVFGTRDGISSTIKPSNANANIHVNSNSDTDPLSHYQAGRNTIYVSIATLGDHACPITVNDLFKKARYPQNIYVGIYQQNEPTDPDCLSMLDQCGAVSENSQHRQIIDGTASNLGDITTLCMMREHIAINRTNIALGAKGPVYGRYMSMKLLGTKQTDFICMIDSHTLFRDNWDDYTIQMWFGIEPDYRHAVLTHYPWGAEHLEKRTKEGNEYSYHICGSVYEGAPNFMVRNANGCFAKNAAKPVRVPFFAGGFSFAATEFWNLVPLDPYLLYIFNGEEFDVATRGWTHGYDFYSPNTDIVGHYYDKGPRRRSPHVGSNQESHALRDKSEKRLNYMWGLWNIRYPEWKDLSLQEIGQKAELRELDKYGLGDKRTLQAFWKFAGINPISKNITIWKEELWANGGLEYVPYKR
mmetsp:Transcript_42705/g.68548  ORF Transcript_42705/g.68548 Transcript_42705/m.68548 type:complete len:475 (+) Transcript_42705:29-1453(+)